MANKLIDWIDRKGVPIMTFTVTLLLTVMVVAQLYFLIFGR